MSTPLEVFLQKHDESDWHLALRSLLPSVNEVDRNAIEIWFRIYPLSVHEYIEGAEDAEPAKLGLAMQGDFGLSDRIDTSHYFLYGHRYWKYVKAAIDDSIASYTGDNSDLATLILKCADAAAAAARADRGLTIAITAAGLMTLRQVGSDRFREAPGEGLAVSGLMAKPAAEVIAARAKDDSQGLFGFLKTVDKKFSVIHNERLKDGRFEITHDQEIASASAKDRSQNWQARDERCWEGPVPVECTSASCGTCWVGILAGAEKLSEVSRRERRAMKVFGYGQTDDEKPIIRLACQAKAHGNVTIVIPSWNAVFGKKVYGNVEELELEPVTTSAKALRETVREAMSPE